MMMKKKKKKKKKKKTRKFLTYPKCICLLVMQIINWKENDFPVCEFGISRKETIFPVRIWTAVSLSLLHDLICGLPRTKSLLGELRRFTNFCIFFFFSFAKLFSPRPQLQFENIREVTQGASRPFGPASSKILSLVEKKHCIEIAFV